MRRHVLQRGREIGDPGIVDLAQGRPDLGPSGQLEVLMREEQVLTGHEPLEHGLDRKRARR
jgi:hypothetical protein